MGIWLIFSSAEIAHADELTVQVSNSDTSTVVISAGSTVTIESATATIDAAQRRLSGALADASSEYGQIWPKAANDGA